MSARKLTNDNGFRIEHLINSSNGNIQLICIELNTSRSTNAAHNTDDYGQLTFQLPGKVKKQRLQSAITGIVFFDLLQLVFTALVHLSRERVHLRATSYCYIIASFPNPQLTTRIFRIVLFQLGLVEIIHYPVADGIFMVDGSGSISTGVGNRGNNPRPSGHPRPPPPTTSAEQVSDLEDQLLSALNLRTCSSSLSLLCHRCRRRHRFFSRSSHARCKAQSDVQLNIRCGQDTHTSEMCLFTFLATEKLYNRPLRNRSDFFDDQITTGFRFQLKFIATPLFIIKR
ncbi:hypothetical protein TcasGA2_TC003647 [Tribolium castaneum]|uniref:Uncharacterized protein n=1 Tax=Tribolium castaneum TaxID=7070 RepID=D6WIQ0_TRICA|nr:hypothetical protein TcasGA2_TC003647 [Tribolium castaneum]